MTVIFLVFLLLPLIPGLNRLPHALKVYRFVWRDWYRRSGRRERSGRPPRGNTEGVTNEPTALALRRQPCTCG